LGWPSRTSSVSDIERSDEHVEYLQPTTHPEYQEYQEYYVHEYV
jgi:hypothetical protein